ncbi:MAG: zinc-binding alcohol dehydrogenase family protein [Acidimicrobiia bacterium]|nr:MAG: zinc-binding alcohol dehydrogenase family protein [Acidimicrobiia bacterium]
MNETMRAVVLTAPGPPEALTILDVPMPVVPPGWVRIRIEAFGLNRSEIHTRLGLAEGVTFPRVLGIECVGTIDAAGTTDMTQGQKVIAMMGGMGRTFDGGYAQYTVVPETQVVPIETDLDWAIVGAVPEMLQTSYGSLTKGLDARSGQTLLIRGGTSSIGMATVGLAKDMGLTVISTTRRPERAQTLVDAGADHALLDTGKVAEQVRTIVPEGVDVALELVGTPTLPDTLRSTRVQGVVCFTGMLSNQWTVENFYPIAYIPSGVRLTAYAGDVGDLPQPVLQSYLDGIADGRINVPIDHVYELHEIRLAHANMESNGATGKLVVRVEH